MSKVKQQFSYLDIILDDGSTVAVKYPTDLIDEVYQSLQEVQQRGDPWWFVKQWDDCSAMYKGISMEHIAVRRIVGLS